jgi:hypothetical protein
MVTLKKNGQMKIQQMAFMLVAVFFFFMLVGLFIIRVQLGNVSETAARLEQEQAIESLAVIANMPELNCDSSTPLCLDKDKMRILSRSSFDYGDFWPVASIKAYLVSSEFETEILCPGIDCNYYEIYNNGQSNKKEVSTFISLCETVMESGYVYENCEVGKLVVGVKIHDE